jgi:dihydrofolate reductase
LQKGAESWAGARVFSGDLAEGIAGLKQELGKDILAHGGAGFARSLIARGLVDEYRFLVHPVTLGSGLPIFSDLSKPLALTLVSSTPFPSGAMANVYRPA